MVLPYSRAAAAAARKMPLHHWRQKAKIVGKCREFTSHLLRLMVSALLTSKEILQSQGLFGDEKFSRSAPQGQPGTTHSKGATLRDLLARDDGETQHEAAAPDAARLTRSGGVKRRNMDDMAGRPMVKGGSGEDKVPTQQNGIS